MALKTLKPMLAVSRSNTLRTLRAGDERIRGSALQKTRERILMRDHGICRCARCQADGHRRAGVIVDHRIPLWAGGREDDANRYAISVECHDLKNAHEAACRARGVFEAWPG